MKIKFLPFLAGGLLMTSTFFSSCLDSDMKEIVYSSETSIYSFSLGTIRIERQGKDTLGKDTIFIDTMNCAKYPFTIDQFKRTIENKDSLPVTADVSKVLCNLKADTELITYKKKDSKGELKDTMWTKKDSLDYRNPVSMTVYAANGIPGKPYTIKVNIHKQYPEALLWKHFGSSKFASSSLIKQKTVLLDQTLYTFGENKDKNIVVERMKLNEGSVSTWEMVATLPAKTNPYSAQVWGDKIYFTASGKLYQLDLNEKNASVQVGTLNNLKNLVGVGNIAANKEVLLAFTQENKVVGLNKDGNLASDQAFGFIKEQAFATNRLSSVSYPARHNTSLVRNIIMTNNPATSANDTTSCVYNYVTNDTQWSKFIMPNPTVCPNLENISMIRYDKKLYAFGGGLESKKIKPFEHFYCSNDNGLTWQKVTKNVVFPQEEGTTKDNNVRPFVNYYTANVEGSYSTIVDANHFIWFIWKDGTMTRGRINRLGFAPKW